MKHKESNIAQKGQRGIQAPATYTADSSTRQYAALPLQPEGNWICYIFTITDVTANLWIDELI